MNKAEPTFEYNSRNTWFDVPRDCVRHMYSFDTVNK